MKASNTHDNFPHYDLNFVDSRANLCLEPSKAHFDHGAYTTLPNPVLLKGIDVFVLCFDNVTHTLFYQSGDTRTITVRTAHAPTMVFRGSPNILSQEHLGQHHGIIFSYPAKSLSSPDDDHGPLLLIMRNQLSHR
jgi:hypothetical protein